MFILWSFFYLLVHIFFIFLFFWVGTEIFFYNLTIIFLGTLDLNLTLIIDQFSTLFLSFISLISSAVLIYSSIYMSTDNTSNRFIILVNLFILSMFILVISPSLLTMMLGWDGLGVISFLLVMYYQNSSSLKSSLITVYTNRFGDVAMLFSMFFLYSMGCWTMEMLFSMNFSIVLILFLILAAMTKSAQVPFSSWLPAAMAAPTPVSSLVHSSTLVTAGVYVIIRFFYLMSWIFSSFYFSIMSLMTSLMAGLIAFTEPDLKKVVAMSTLSQLGLMMYSISMGEMKLCFFHMVCHALFKSLLFLSCGMIIFLSFGSQDMRSMGSFSFSSPNIFFMFLISSMSLFGFPFSTGFFSKDLILEFSLLSSNSLFNFFLLVFSCIMTVLYSLRLMFYGLSSYRFGEKLFCFNENFKMMIGMVFLFIWSVFMGKMLFSYFFSSPICLLSFLDKLIGLIIIFSGLILNLMFKNKFSIKIFSFNLLGEMMFLNWLYSSYFSSKMSSMSKLTLIDITWMELMGSKNMMSVLLSMNYSSIFSKFSLLKLSLILLILMILFFA